MRNRGEEAYSYFLEGYNCSQAVVMAYRDFFPSHALSSILSLSSPFGGGMGRLREVCGTVSGAFIVLGSVYGFNVPGDGEKKKILYGKMQEFASLYEKENGSIICRNLLGLEGKSSPRPDERTKEYYEKRPCPSLCRSSASILEHFLIDNGILDINGEIKK